uniref:Uncharacterized protein n=1 Tax=Oncorhynchus mykiss TaxID=8022 RepID=A0A8C7TYW2_ONCMY
MMRTVVNFMVLPYAIKKRPVCALLWKVRFVCILCVVVVAHVLCATLLLQRPNMMVCRVGGALETIQEQYFLLNLCSSMNVPEVAYFLYLMYMISTHWGQDKAYTLETAAVTGAVISVLIKGVLFWGLDRSE